MKTTGIKFAHFLPGVVAGAGAGILGTVFLFPSATDRLERSGGNGPASIETRAESQDSDSQNLESPAASIRTLAEPSTEAGLRQEHETAENDTVAALREAIKTPSTSGKLQYLTLLQQLTAEEAPRMLEVFREMSRQGYKVREYDRLFWERWAELDGPGVAKIMFERDKRFKETGLSNLAISTWAKNDPEAAADWLAQQEDIPLREGMTKGLLEGMAAADPDQAQEFLLSGNFTPDQIAYGFSQIARQKLMQDGLDSVGQWYAEFSENDANFETVTNAATQIYSRAAFSDALHWANQLEGSRDAVLRARGQLHARLADGRPDGLITFLGSEKYAHNIAGVEALTSRAIDRWLRTTPYAMGTWLQQNEDIPNYDLIVKPFAEKVAVDDPNAARAWAGTIRDPELRETVLENLSGN